MRALIGLSARQFSSQPRFGKFPVPFYAGNGDLKCLGRLLQAQAGKEAQFDHACLARVHFLQGFQGVVKRDQVLAVVPRGIQRLIESDVLEASAALVRQVRSRGIYENPPHDLRRDGKEVGAIFPSHSLNIRKTKISLVYQGARLEGLSGLLPAHVSVRDVVQFGVNQRGQLIERLPVAVAPGAQKPRDFR